MRSHRSHIGNPLAGAGASAAGAGAAAGASVGERGQRREPPRGQQPGQRREPLWGQQPERRRGGRGGGSSGGSGGGCSGLGRRLDHGVDLALGYDPRQLVGDDDGRHDVAGTQVGQQGLFPIAHDLGIPFLRVLVREHAIPLRPPDDDLVARDRQDLARFDLHHVNRCRGGRRRDRRRHVHSGLELADADIPSFELELEAVGNRVLGRLAGGVLADDLVAVHADDGSLDDVAAHRRRRRSRLRDSRGARLLSRRDGSGRRKQSDPEDDRESSRSCLH